MLTRSHSQHGGIHPEGPSKHLRWVPHPPSEDALSASPGLLGNEDEVAAQKSALQTLGSSLLMRARQHRLHVRQMDFTGSEG